MSNAIPYKEIGSHRNTKKTTEEFISQAKNVWGDKYDYSKTIYDGVNKKVIIVCPEHGEFEIKPIDFLHGHGCPACGGVKRLTNSSFIEKAKSVHGNKYDYSLVNYKNNSTPVEIICHQKDANGNEHGVFIQTPRNHLQGDGCPKCFKSFKKTTEEFIQQARAVHGDKYDYSKVVYNGNKTPITIICPKHGEFTQTPIYHLQGHGCQKCYYERSGQLRKKSLEEFIKQANEIHNNKYDYSKVNYVNNKTLVTIICPKHGEFQQTPEKHINRGQGCPICDESHMERDLAIALEKGQIIFEREKRFKWLKLKNYMPLDFYLPNYNIAIECQGEQHYREYPEFNGKRSLESVTERDVLKNHLCLANGIKVLYFAHSKTIIGHSDIYNEDNVFTTYSSLIEYIKKKTLFEEIIGELNF